MAAEEIRSDPKNENLSPLTACPVVCHPFHRQDCHQRRIIPTSQQGKAIKQLHINHIGRENSKNDRTSQYSGYTWTLIQKKSKVAPHVLIIRLQTKRKSNVTWNTWEAMGIWQELTSLQLIINIILYCRLPVVKQVEGFSVDNLT